MDINNYLNNSIKFLPFIIVVCFVIYSIISADVKSIIFLSGLLITVFLTNIILPFNGNAIPRKESTAAVAPEKQNKGVYKSGQTNNTFRQLANDAGQLATNAKNSVAAIFAVLSSSGQHGGKKTVGGEKGQECQLLFLDDDSKGNGKPISRIPLCIVTMWYLFSYILTIIGTEKIWGDNIPVIVILGLISIFYTVWFVYRSDCVDNFFTDENKDTFLIWFSPVIIGSLCGFLWALYISAINITELKYFAGLTKDERCSRPKRALYKCEFKNPV